MKKRKESTVGIIGAGPAGAMCAHELAGSGTEVILFDHKAPWEKPCGGMLSARVFEEFPLMREYPFPKMEFNEIMLISPRSDMTTKELTRPIYTISREELGRYLLDRAIGSGAQFVQERVKSVKRAGTGWSIASEGGTWDCGIIIGADGAHGIVKKSIDGSKPGTGNVLTCGYFLTGVRESHCIFKFLDRLGYLWVYPRPNDHSIGIGYIHSSEKPTGEKMFMILEKFIRGYCPEAVKKAKWSSFIPIAHDPRQYDAPCSGDGWILIGDAAGNVDPLTGEGIYYAMKSARAAARSITEGSNFGACRDEACGTLLKEKAKILKNLIKTEQQSGPEVAGAFYYHIMCK